MKCPPTQVAVVLKTKSAILIYTLPSSVDSFYSTNMLSNEYALKYTVVFFRFSAQVFFDVSREEELHIIYVKNFSPVQLHSLFPALCPSPSPAKDNGSLPSCPDHQSVLFSFYR